MPATTKELRVLICEKEYLQALDIETQLEQVGATPSGTFSNYEELLAGLQGNSLQYNAAVLTVEADQAAFAPAMALLIGAGTAIAFVSGHPHDEVPLDFAHLPFFSKPIHLESIAADLRASVAPRGARHIG